MAISKQELSFDVVHLSLSIDKFKTLISNQKWLINLNEENSSIAEMITQLFINYHDIGTFLTLPELWSNAINTRAENIPRPQNPFILYRKDISKGLIKANKTMSVRDSSKLASSIWKTLSNHERGFWYQLFQIVKLKHNLNYPNYKYRPKRNKTDKKKRNRRSCNSLKSDNVNTYNFQPEDPTITSVENYNRQQVMPIDIQNNANENTFLLELQQEVALIDEFNELDIFNNNAFNLNFY